MYEAYFHLQKRPFSATPDAQCFFATESLQEILDQLVLRAEGGEGIGVVCGAAGTGKTVLCRCVVRELASRMTPVFLANANYPTRRALLQTILFELGHKYHGLEEQELRLTTLSLLRELALVGRGLVLIVDEAHLLSDKLLEELRLLACMSEAGQPLIRLILAGQPALEERLLAPQLEALNQRIVCQLFLEPLTRRESIEYIEYRLAWSGGDVDEAFEPAALEAIAMASGGLPRCLNHLCDHALLLTFVQEQQRVTADIVADALVDLQQLPLQWNTRVAADESLSSTASDDDAAPVSGGRFHRDADLAVAAPTAETVCFEIGGDPLPEVEVEDEVAEIDVEVEEDVVETLSLPAAPAPRVMPAVELTPRPASPVRPSSPAAPRQALAEESLDDRYAVLDRKMPDFRRTFDNATVATNWLAAPAGEIPAAPQPPELPLPASDDAWEDADAGDLVAYDDEDATPAIDQDIVLPAETAPLASAAPQDGQDPFPSADDLLEARILESCRDLQAEIGRWREEEITDSTDLETEAAIEDASAERDADFTDEVAAETLTGKSYDIVEPQPHQETFRTSGTTRPDPVPVAEARDNAQPRYRLLFSTLRRRLGRGR